MEITLDSLYIKKINVQYKCNVLIMRTIIPQFNMQSMTQL